MTLVVQSDISICDKCSRWRENILMTFSFHFFTEKALALSLIFPRYPRRLLGHC